MKWKLRFFLFLILTFNYGNFEVFSIKIGTYSEIKKEIIKDNNLNSYYKEMLLEEEMLIAEKIEFILKEVNFLKKKKEFIQNEISKLDKNNSYENALSSFIELKSKMKTDPLFKILALGFSIPRQMSYIGSQNIEQNNQNKYCPAGCVVP